MSDQARPSAVVIGVGNPLQGDDGLGIAAAAALREWWTFEPSLDVLDGGTWGIGLLPAIEGAERLLLIDAIDVGAPPGTPVTLEKAELPRLFSLRVSPHQVDLRETLALAELRGRLPAETVALGIQPERLDWGEDLSPAVRAGFSELLERVVRRLEAWGYRAERKSGARPCTR